MRLRSTFAVMLAAVLALPGLVSCASNVRVTREPTTPLTEYDTIGIRVRSASAVARPHVPLFTEDVVAHLRDGAEYRIVDGDGADVVVEIVILDFDPGDPGERAAGLGGEASVHVRATLRDGGTGDVVAEVEAEGDSKRASDTTVNGVMVSSRTDLPQLAIDDVATALAN